MRAMPEEDVAAFKLKVMCVFVYKYMRKIRNEPGGRNTTIQSAWNNRKLCVYVYFKYSFILSIIKGELRFFFYIRKEFYEYICSFGFNTILKLIVFIIFHFMNIIK